MASEPPRADIAGGIIKVLGAIVGLIAFVAAKSCVFSAHHAGQIGEQVTRSAAHYAPDAVEHLRPPAGAFVGDTIDHSGTAASRASDAEHRSAVDHAGEVLQEAGKEAAHRGLEEAVRSATSSDDTTTNADAAPP